MHPRNAGPKSVEERETVLCIFEPNANVRELPGLLLTKGEHPMMLPERPNAPQANPKQSVGGAEFGFAGLAFEHGECWCRRARFSSTSPE